MIKEVLDANKNYHVSQTAQVGLTKYQNTTIWMAYTTHSYFLKSSGSSEVQDQGAA